MLLKIRHALLEVNNHPNAKQSAIIINNEIIITSGCILQPYVRPMLPFVADHTNENVCASTKIIHKLQQCKLVNAQEVQSEEAQHLNSFSYQVTFDRRKLPAARTERNANVPHILTRYRAKLLYVFSSESISRNLHKMLYTITINNSNTKYNNEVLLTSFLILTMRPAKTNESPERFERFLEHIAHYLRYKYPVRPLDDVLTMCTPFGMENFYKTISIGKVSNVIGKDGSLFVLSNNLPLGCEGSAVFNNKLRLIGLIICTAFQRNNENIQITMAANFAHLLRDFMDQLGVKITTVMLPREPSNFAWERTLVVIEAAGSQGTGTLVKVQNKKFILTCSHVVFQVNSTVVCRSVDGEFEADVLWRNPHYDTAFDVALLSAPDVIPERYCVRLAQSKPCLGQTVYNAGFPYFVNFNLKYDFNPSIFQGRIIKYTPAAIMSDGCVQAGQSGGPMFDEHGSIMGICVSNIKMDNIVYPNINSAVPIVTIRSILEDYAKTNDLGILNNLVANQDIQRVWSLTPPSIINIGENYIPMGAAIVTFNLIHRPEILKLGWERVRVEEYVSNPMRCVNCQRLGHTLLSDVFESFEWFHMKIEGREKSTICVLYDFLSYLYLYPEQKRHVFKSLSKIQKSEFMKYDTLGGISYTGSYIDLLKTKAKKYG